MSAGRGRPTKLDDIRAKKIVDAIKAGCSRRAAADCVGVSKAALENWIRRGDEGDTDYVDFVDRVRRADSEAEQRHTKQLTDAADAGDLRATMFWLQSRRREEWGPGPLAQANDAKAVDTIVDAEADKELIASLYAATQSRAAK